MSENLVSSRTPNWIPLPSFGIDKKKPIVEVDEKDFFTKGEVVFFYERQGIGRVKNRRGEFVDFDVSQVDFVGQKNSSEFITDGSPVGYDISITSHGLKISKMKIY